MIIPMVLAASFIIKFLAFVWFLCAIVLVFVILIQKGKGGGLSSAFGGGMASSVLGPNPKKPMTWFTIGMVAVFLLLAVFLDKFYRPTVSNVPAMPTQEQTAPAPPAQTAPATTGQAKPPVTQQNMPQTVPVDVNSTQ